VEIGETRTDRVLQATLTGLSSRQRVIADNVANVDTPGFKASGVEFEALLRKAAGGSDGFRLLSVQGAVEAPPEDPRTVAPRIVTMADTSLRADGNNVDVDQQMVQLAETNITYNAVAQLTGARLQLLRTVINEGRR
jgi:flagellar basal-body rod protein FlgB